MTIKYSFNIAWSDEDEEYVATCPAFPGLSAYGATEEEALAEAKVALGLFIESCQDRNIPLPEPQVVENYSGQTRLRLPKHLHRQAAQAAESQGMSLNQVLILALQKFLTGEHTGQRYLDEIKSLLRVQNERNQVAIASSAWTRSAIREKTVRIETETERIYLPPIESKKGN